jgi:ketosteroid isomerase-like protein
MKSFLFLISTCLFLQTATAQPVAKSNADAALQEMINAERAFASESVQKNTREAFISFMAGDGIILRKGKIINAKQNWSAQQADSSELHWYPDVADMSAAGDMGYTSGPWQYKLKRGDQQPVAFGHFNTVWKKQADGSWKVVVDLGISHARPAQQANENHVALPTFKSVPVNGKSIDALKTSMLDAEKAFIMLQASTNNRYKKFMMPDMRVYRNRHFPYVSADSVNNFVAKSISEPTFELVGGDIASSGDLGYTYGNTLQGTTAGNYLRVWKRNSDGYWRIVLDVVDQ